jgi:hypothetical protein
MEATCSSEKPVDFQKTIRRVIPEDRTLHNHSFVLLSIGFLSILFKGDENQSLSLKLHGSYLVQPCLCFVSVFLSEM